MLERIEDTSRGRVDQAFWQDFYKLEGMSGGDYVTGWLNVFFPYLSDEAGDDLPSPNAWLRWRAANPAGPLDDDDDTLFDLVNEFPTLKSFPSGLTSAPFTWRFLRSRRSMSFVAGFFGVTQDEGGALRPRLGWAVTPALASRRCSVRASWRTGIPRFSPRDSQGLTDLSWLRDEVEGVKPFALELACCRQLSTLEGLGGLSALTELTVGQLDRLENLEGLRGLSGLTALTIEQVDRLENLDDLRWLTGLKRLEVNRCPKLRDIGALSALTALEELTLQHCPAVADLSSIADLPNLSSLCFWSYPGFDGPQRSREEVRAMQQKLRATKGLAAGAKPF